MGRILGDGDLTVTWCLDSMGLVRYCTQSRRKERDQCVYKSIDSGEDIWLPPQRFTPTQKLGLATMVMRKQGLERMS